jgi:large subunit ribosomal protein L33
MAKAAKREYVWLQCKECGNLNYRTSINVMGGVPKLELRKFCKRERKHVVHKIKRK